MRDFHFALFIVLMTGCQSVSKNTSAPLSIVRKHVDPEPIGSSFKVEQWIFEASEGDCRARWAVFVPTQAPSTIEIFQEMATSRSLRSCHADFAKQEPLYKALLASVLAHYPKHEISSLTIGPNSFVDHNARMAVAAQSPIWKNYLIKRKAHRYLNGNREFVQIFNAADVGAEWRKIFAEQGLRLELSSVEKVFIEKTLPTHAGIYVFEVSAQ